MSYRCAYGVWNCRICVPNQVFRSDKERAYAAYRCRVAQGDRTYLNVPFADKAIAKKLGAMWDPDTKRWYAPRKDRLAAFSRWMPAQVALVKQSDAAPPLVALERTRNAISYDELMEALAATAPPVETVKVVSEPVKVNVRAYNR